MRPLTVGEILTAGLQVARRHLAVLVPVGLVVSVLNVAVTLGVLAANGSLRDYASGAYLRLPAQPTPADAEAIFSMLFKVLSATAAGQVVSLIAAPFLAGIAAPLAAQAATSGSTDRKGPFSRLKGRWGLLLAASVAAGLLTAAGYALFIVPGIMLWLVLLPLGPVTAMEGLPLAASFRRAAAVSRASKGRILGVVLLTWLFGALVSIVIGMLLGSAGMSADPMRRLWLTEGIAVLTASFVVAWTSCVTAMLYIDIRMRREGLAQALQAAAR